MQAVTETSDAEIDAMGYFQIMVWAVQRGNFSLAMEAARFADDRAATTKREAAEP
jgi:hypothetical protein